MSVESLTPAELAIGISQGYREFIEREERRGAREPRNYVWASSWRACTRQMALEMICPGVLPEFDAFQLANFRRGKDRERNLKSDLAQAGRDSDPRFEVVGQEERFEIRDRKGRVVIVGKVDAQIQIGRTKYPTEMKSWSPTLVAKVKTFEDLFENRYTRSGAHQLLSYLFARNAPVGFMLLDRNGLPLLLPVELERHLDRAEDFLSRSEIALDAKEAWEKIRPEHPVSQVQSILVDGAEAMPPFHDDPDECRKCGFFGSACQPPLSYAGAEVVVDEELIQLLEDREYLKRSKDQYEEADEKVKDRLREVPIAIAGPFLIQGKYRKTTRPVFPDEATKQKYMVSDPKGSWVMTIERVADS